MALNVEGTNKQIGITQLSPCACTQEPANLIHEGRVPPSSLLLKGAERTQVSLIGKQSFQSVRAHSADEFVLQVAVADEEALSLKSGLPP